MTSTTIFTESTTQTNTATTYTTTITSRITLVQPTIASFNGLNYYTYQNNYNFNLNRASVPYDAASFTGTNYVRNGVAVRYLNNVRTSSLTGTYWPDSSGTTCILPGEFQNYECSQVTVTMQGFFYAATAGTYKLSIRGTNNFVDNLLAIWTGSKAYNKPNQRISNGNANFIATRIGAEESIGGETSLTLQAGEYVPITVMWMNGGGPGGFQFYVDQYDTTGTLVQTTQDTSQFFLPPCGGTSNPFVFS